MQQSAPRMAGMGQRQSRGRQSAAMTARMGQRWSGETSGAGLTPYLPGSPCCHGGAIPTIPLCFQGAGLQKGGGEGEDKVSAADIDPPQKLSWQCRPTAGPEQRGEASGTGLTPPSHPSPAPWSQRGKEKEQQAYTQFGGGRDNGGGTGPDEKQWQGQMWDSITASSTPLSSPMAQKLEAGAGAGG